MIELTLEARDLVTIFFLFVAAVVAFPMARDIGVGLYELVRTHVFSSPVRDYNTVTVGRGMDGSLLYDLRTTDEEPQEFVREAADLLQKVAEDIS